MLVAERLRAEQESAERKQENIKIYLPMEKYVVGDSLHFPAIKSSGHVSAVRAGVNPELGEFDVLSVTMEGGAQKLFAAGLESNT